jgi:glycyl-tRNA synthetase alpha subunit
LRIRNMAYATAKLYYETRKQLGFPLLVKQDVERI